MISKKIGEHDTDYAVLSILSNSPGGLSMSELKQAFKKFAEPTGDNLKTLVNRNDVAIDQIIGNIVSHRSSKNNMIYKGFIQYSDGILSITASGREHLLELSKDLYRNNME